MPTRTVYNQLTTDKPFEAVRDAARQSFQIVGGEIHDTENGITIEKGTREVKMAFTTMGFSARVEIRPITEDKYDLICTIRWLPHWFNFLMFVWGFVSLFTWIYNIMYFLVNPAPNYQLALDRVEFYLE